VNIARDKSGGVSRRLGVVPRRLIEPDWTAIHRELKRKHVTLPILWDEYIERNPQGYR
jgi:transposase